jgi:tyrosine-protein phosphatase YwqE
MSIFSSIFGKKEKEPGYPELHDLSALAVDMHSHLIPGIDDGVKSIEESLEMIRGFAALGYKKLITTPHVMSDYYRNTPEIILEGLEKVRSAVKAENIPIQIEASAEYYLDEMFVTKLQNKEILKFGANYLLFEISYVNPPENILSAIFEINVHGFTPVLAHPERYPFWYDKFEEFEKIREAGALLQLNVNSLTGYYGPGAKAIAEKMIDRNMIDFIGSDLHGQRHLDALNRVIKEKSLRKLLSHGVKNSSLLEQ